jgi:predicted phosphate transport protein (TIGR00153 family)
MSSGRMLAWFEKRRRSKTLNLAQQHIALAVETVQELNRALSAFSKKDSVAVDASFNRLFKEEIEIDDLRRTIMEELSKGELPPQYREDLKGLVSHLDGMADMVKDSARSVKVLQEVDVPKEIMDSYIKIGNDLVESVRALRTGIEALGTGPDDLRAATIKVDECEARIDDEYLSTKILIVEKGKNLYASDIMAMRDLVEFLEQASDAIVRTADYIRILAAEELSGRG